MKRTIAFFAAAFFEVGAIVYSAARVVDRHYAGRAGSEAAQRLEWEARLVNHFCLNRIPPLGGREAIPSEWGRALGSTIALRQGAGEIVGEHPALRSRADEIRALTPGQSLQMSIPQNGEFTHVIVLRPNLPGDQLLLISKTGGQISAEVPRPPIGPLGWALIGGLVGALVLTMASRSLGVAPPKS